MPSSKCKELYILNSKSLIMVKLYFYATKDDYE